MQIDLLETFLDLTESRSFTRTADRMGLTQSTVSARIAALEAALNARLFTRSRAGAELTAEGQRFLPHARNLRHDWHQARRQISLPGPATRAFRLGIQNDLAAQHIGAWVNDFRRALPETAFYIEPDYSAQMCADLVMGLQDFAVLFTPKPHPDLHFTQAGEVPYRMVSTHATKRAEVDPATYIQSPFSPAFDAMHQDLLPEFSQSPLSVGQSSAVQTLLLAIGGTGYLIAPAAIALAATTRAHLVEDAPTLRQPVYTALHLRNRIAPLHRRLTRIVQRNLGGG